MLSKSAIRKLAVAYRRSFTRVLGYDSRLPLELANRLWSHADRLVAEGRCLKAGNRTTVVRVDSGEQSWLLKRYNCRGPLHTAAHLLMRSRARRNWCYGRHLWSRGIATPLPMAFLEHRLGPFRTRSYLLTGFVPGTSLYDLFRREEPVPRVRHTLVREFADLWRRLGELRLSHGDTKTTNFLVTAEDRLWLIDLDGMRFHWSGVTFRLARNRDWKRFMENWRDAPHIASAFRTAVEGRPDASVHNEPTRNLRH